MRIFNPNNLTSPNLSDPRILKRFQSAMYFAAAYSSSSGRAKFLSKRLIDSYLGHSGNPISKFLRELLLIDSGEAYIPDVMCKQYFFRKSGVEYLKSVIKDGNKEDYSSWTRKVPSEIKQKKEDSPSVGLIGSYHSVIQVSGPIFSEQEYIEAAEFITQPYIKELETGKFEYKDSSNRFWHPLQLVNSRTRRIIQAKYGFCHNYDIEASAPTLLLQHARHLGLSESTPFIDEYLNNKKLIRQNLADELHIEVDEVKKVINSLFNGGKLNTTKYCRIFVELGRNRVVTNKLINNEFIKGLQTDIQKIWSTLSPTIERRIKVDLKTGKTRKCPISGKDKAPIYFMLERKVQNAANEFMEEYVKTSVFLEHDGWVTKKEVNLTELEEYIKLATGFSVKIDYEKI